MRVRLPIALLSVPFLALGVVAQTPPAQTPPPQQPQTPAFRTRIDSVSVDVVVTDKDGRPVTDLTAEDFEVRESNKPQTIDTFKLIRLNDAVNLDPTTIREIHSLEDQAREAARDDVRIFVIFLDDYHVRRGNSLRIRDQLARFTDQLGPRDLVAIMYPLTPIAAITFTQSPASTAQALMNFEGRKYDYTPKNAYEERLAYQPPVVIERYRNDQTITALRSVCTFLGTLRDGRKTVLFVSEGMSGTLPSGVATKGSIPLPGAGPQFGAPRQSSTLEDSVAAFNNVDLLNQMRDVFAAAARANTSVYTLDPRGLATSEFDMADNVANETDRRTLNESIDSLRIIADQTDGRPIVGTNSPALGLKQMVQDSSTYYLLSYTSSLAPRDGRFHEIKVSVKRKGVDVRARKGYWAYSAEDVARATGKAAAAASGPPPEIEEALSTIADRPPGRAVQVWLGAERGPAEKARVTFAWEALAPAASADPADVVDRVTVTANSIYGDLLFKGTVPRDPQALRPCGRVTFDAPAGAVQVSVVAENAKGMRLDRDESTLEVPDFTAAGPLITTPIVFRGRTARDMQQLRAAAAPVPAASRIFSRTERLLVRFQAYGRGGSTPAVTMRLLNSLGKVMAPLPAPTKLDTGAFEAEIGLGALQPSDYLIEIVADTGGASAKSLIAIRITG